MTSPALERLGFLLDELAALVDNARVGVLGGEAKERTLARLDEILKLIRGE